VLGDTPGVFLGPRSTLEVGPREAEVKSTYLCSIMILTDKVAHATDVVGVSCVLILPAQRLAP